ncbi:6-phosphogluconate dehydrogenase [Polynucleobacter sp. SHI8]|uniref:hypothetical protein n=1 Tax=unclassified Polynucleobacter TaxID=2640945 RepID=UPI00248F9B8A|nr:MULTISPECIES: hypothetical protein [unclassified Polynucleobacter]BDW12242.1 6-phosphogluconate dehydrogenase [Polynucleobacter sp. SHI2]BDW14690.1 6-phosphogluconate dehydrogenase [Polynucleobacter sp. SHI8]
MAKFLSRFILFLFILIILFVLYTWLTLSYSYSNGSRAGFLQKFSKRGWVCKTWEGELVTGSMLGNQEKFSFSVRDEDLAKMVSSNIGKRVEIEYDQHVGVPTNCFAETEYYVKKIKSVPDIRDELLQKAQPGEINK